VSVVYGVGCTLLTYRLSTIRGECSVRGGLYFVNISPQYHMG